MPKRHRGSHEPERARPAAAIYARVSTIDQNCEMQLAELRGFNERSDWTSVEYVDQGFSGAKRSRPALNRLMSDARLRKFHVVVCWKLDRFGRSMIDLIENVRELDTLGIRFVCPTQGIDTDQKSPTGRLILHILAALAEFERELIRERVRAGVAEAQRRGKHCGRPARIYRRDQAAEMRATGMSWRAIAKALNVSVRSLRRGVAKTLSEQAPVRDAKNRRLGHRIARGKGTGLATSSGSDDADK